MAKKHIWIKESAVRFYRIMLYIFTVGMILFLFPREGKFRYEFQKGRPWMHESLIAPFDFPLYKYEAEVQAEKDNILSGYMPYFTYDSKIAEEQRNSFREYLVKSLQQYQEKHESEKSLIQVHKQKVIDSLSQSLDFIFRKGIIEMPDNVNAKAIIRIENNLAEETDVLECFTLKSAYRHLWRDASSIGNNLASATGSSFLDEFFKNLPLDRFVKVNLIYDESASTNAREELLRKVSLTTGLVQRGERIILTGDIVNDATYRILMSLKKESESRIGQIGNSKIIIFGQFLLIAVIVLLLFLFLLHHQKEIPNQPIKFSFIIVLIMIMILLSSLFLKYQVASLYIIPFALVPIIINSFYNARMALVIHVLLTLLIGFWAPNSFEFVLLNTVVGVVVMLRLSNQFNRNRIFFTSLLVIITYSILFYSKYLIQEADWRSVETNYFYYFAVNGLLLLTSIPLIYFFERTFGFLSDTSLLELSDTNQPLLRKLAEVAPGTFQHSLQVANLAEDAIRHIGGSVLLVRAGSLYHDIGKMKNPRYFIENQMNVANPHDEIEAVNSAKIIIEHIEEGVQMAAKYDLPQRVVDFIRSHHGDTTVMYFYKLFLKKYPEQEVNLHQFTYPGPKPQTKEVAVVMLADSVEAASRSLRTYNAKSISDMVEIIISTYLEKGQLNEADITLKEITQIKEIFKERLQIIYHLRIAYPE